jgi:Flp pilus assembly protein TadD
MNSGPEATGFRFGKDSFGSGLALCAVLGLGLAGCAQPSAEQSSLNKINSTTRMSIADIASSGGDTESARSILAAAAQADPKNGDVGLHYAQALLDSGRPQEAIAAARQVADRSAHDPAMVVRAAQMELRAGDALTASATFQSVVAHGGGGTPALNGLGVARAQLGDLPGAEDAFRRAVQSSPGDYAARNNLALALVLQGRAAEAVPMLQSLADEPGVPGRVKHNLALAYARAGDTDQAATVLAGVVGNSAASREVAAFTNSRTDPGTMVASRLAPAEIMDGRTSGAAYAGIIPPPTTGSGAPAAFAAAAPMEPKASDIRPAPVATGQSAPIGLSQPAPTKTAVAAASAPLSDKEAAAPVLLPASVVSGPVPHVMTPAPVTAASVVTPVAKPAPPPAPAPVVAAAPSPAPQQVATADTAPAPSAVGPASVAVTEPTDNGAIKVRIAAVPSQSAALALWQNLTGLVPDLLTGRTPLVKMEKDHGKLAWRLGTGGFQDVAAAEQFCRKLRERGPNCTLGL